MTFNWLQLRSLNRNSVASCRWSGPILNLLTQIRHAHILLWRTFRYTTLQWRHNERDGVSNHQPHDCLLNRSSDADQRKHQSSASLAFVREIHRWPVNSPHKWPVTLKIFPFDDGFVQCLATPWTSLQCCDLERHHAKELLIMSISHVGDMVIGNSNSFAGKGVLCAQISRELDTVKIR